MIGKIWRPAVFQGKGNSGPYFEGWFFKITDAAEKQTLAFIPGLFVGKTAAESHAFVMILDAETHSSSYHVYASDEFSASATELDIRIGANRFCREFFEINIASPQRTVSGRIEMGAWSPWPVRLTSPGVMGWYAFMPFMECYHGVLSFDHPLSGSLMLNGTAHDFSGGRGYVEKDWGRSFPSAYLWMQSNHFGTSGLSLMASVANIPWLGSSFRGFIVGLWLNGRLLRFTTYTGARLLACKIDDRFVAVHIQDKRHELRLRAERTRSAVLHAPYDVSMTPKVHETLGSVVELELYRRRRNSRELMLADTGRNAGLDVNGRLEEIVC